MNQNTGDVVTNDMSNNSGPLFDRKMFDALDFSKFESLFKPSISITNPGSGLLVRPLCASDYNTGFLDVLAQLTTVGDISYDEYKERFRSMQQCPDTYYVTVIEDTTLGQVVGAASLVVEKKFIHKCALRGRIEDVVVSGHYRGKQLGKLLIAVLVLLSEHLGVYKVTLDCHDHMIPFYQTLGFKREEGNSNYMQIRFSS